MLTGSRMSIEYNYLIDQTEYRAFKLHLHLLSHGNRRVITSCSFSFESVPSTFLGTISHNSSKAMALPNGSLQRHRKQTLAESLARGCYVSL